MGQSLLGAGGPNIFQRSPTDCRLTKTLGSCDKVFSTMKALYFLIRVIVTRKVWEVKPAATRWLENVANLISHHQYLAKCPPLKTVTNAWWIKKFNSVYTSTVWIITISLGSEEYLTNCTVARTMIDNGRPAFQYTWVHIDSLCWSLSGANNVLP